VTVFGLVNHLGACRTRHPGLLSLSPPSVGRLNEYPAKAGGVNSHIAWYIARIRGLALFADAWLKELACGDSTSEGCSRQALYKSRFTTFCCME